MNVQPSEVVPPFTGLAATNPAKKGPPRNTGTPHAAPITSLHYRING